MLLAFECRVLRPPDKEVLERSLLMAKALLQGNAGDLVQPRKLAGALEPGEFRIGLQIPDLLLPLEERIGSPAQDMVVDEARTAERLS